MVLYRLCRQRYVDLSGLGAKKTGGRWNRKGIGALYAAANASLAVVEVLVHIDKSEIPEDYTLIELSVPASAIVHFEADQTEKLDELYESGHSGLDWPDDRLGFSVPSAVVPQDRIFVLYPDAPRSSQMMILEITSFAFDRRLFSPVANPSG